MKSEWNSLQKVITTEKSMKYKIINVAPSVSPAERSHWQNTSPKGERRGILQGSAVVPDLVFLIKQFQKWRRHAKMPDDIT